MNLTLDHLTELESIAIQAAKKAGEMIQEKVSTDHQVLRKDGGNSLASQVVTEVDLASQDLILETIESTFTRFDLGLLTEESPDDSSRHRHDHFWCIDPLDGTLAFTKGLPGYCVSIALIARDGTPKIGVVFDPSTSTLYHAIRGNGAFKNKQPWLVKNPDSNTPLTVMIDDSFVTRAKHPDFQKALQNFATRLGHSKVKMIDHAGAVLNACWVADLAPALYFKFPKSKPGGGSLWDFGATTCFFNELDLPVSDIHGTPLNLNPEGQTFMNHCGVLFASHPSLTQIEELTPK